MTIIRGVAKRHEVATPGDRVGAWYTPPWLCKRACLLAGVRPGTRVLDLGAGTGNITRTAIAMGAIVTAVEIDPRRESELRAIVGDRGRVIIGDVFEVDDMGEHDVGVLNPIWELDYEPRFLLRALVFCPRAVGIVSGDAMYGRGRSALWRRMRRIAIEQQIPRVVYSGGGGQEETDLVLVGRRVRPLAAGEPEDVRLTQFVRPERVRS